MKKMYRLAPAMLVFVVCAFSGHSATAKDEFVADINKAGRQRMLSQRIVKAYCLVGQDIQAHVYKEQLAEAVNQFDLQLRELKAVAPTAEIKDAIAETEARWRPFREIVSAQPSRAGAQRLIALDAALLAAAENVVALLEKHANAPTARLVNLSGRMRMLSQRVAKFYMLRSWELDDPEIADGMTQARKEFASGLDELDRNGGSTPEIRNSLADARKQWNVLVHFMDRETVPMPIFAAMAAEKVFEIAENLTTQFEKLASP